MPIRYHRSPASYIVIATKVGDDEDTYDNAVRKWKAINSLQSTFNVKLANGDEEKRILRPLLDEGWVTDNGNGKLQKRVWTPVAELKACRRRRTDSLRSSDL